MTKKLLIIIPIVVILAAAATALVLLQKQQKVDVEYNADAFGEYWTKHFYTMGVDKNCKHLLVCSIYYDPVTNASDCHKTYCGKGVNKPWSCDFEPIIEKHTYVLQSIAGATNDDFGNVYHRIGLKCAYCTKQYFDHYDAMMKCKLNSPECDGSCLGLKIGDIVEVDG